MKLRFEPVHRLCTEAADDGTVPGIVLLVASGGTVVFHDAFGARQLVPRRLPAFPDTLYDVASVTKAVVTSVLAMREVAAGRLALDAPVVELLPEFEGADRARVTVRQLLCHASGLPPHRPFWRQAAAAPSERRAIALLAAREPLEYAPGTRAVYSDLGFIVLGWLIERLAGERLDVLAGKQIVAPLALAATTFMSLSEPEARARVLGDRSIAATQLCPERRRVLIGEVDDLNAMAMGGIAGHAGLFSTAEDLSRIAAALCRAWRGDDAGGGALVEHDVVRAFWSPSGIEGSTWRLGWDGPAAANSQAGTKFSRAGVGHLGFTGCSLWIDPARETWIVLLTNRVHPTVPKDDRFKRFRPMLHDAIADALAS
jgi:CubicO group peptidase (beta-lactamase class C family)